MSPETFAQLKKDFAAKGVSRTIYALVTPETEATKNKVYDGDLADEIDRTLEHGGSLVGREAIVKAVHRARASHLDQFRGAWTERQDHLHEDFFKTWLDWVKPISPIAKEEFRFQYPTAGASEGLREAINEYGARSRGKDFKPEIYLFNGEYEGYQSYADAAYIPTSKFNRSDWPAMIDAMAEASKDKPVQLYISQPSALDGNVWEGYDEFMQALAKKAPNVEVILDLTYVGCIARDAHIQTDYPNIKAIAFSLSKPMGAYYDRIGGLIAKAGADGKEPYPGLFGNKWFKNIASLNIGTQFMRDHAVQEIPRKYAPIQAAAIRQVAAGAKGTKAEFLKDLAPSDVFVLATAPMPSEKSDETEYLGRIGHEGQEQIRTCLTPLMAKLIGTEHAQERNQLIQDAQER